MVFAPLGGAQGPTSSTPFSDSSDDCLVVGEVSTPVCTVGHEGVASVDVLDCLVNGCIFRATADATGSSLVAFEYSLRSVVRANNVEGEICMVAGTAVTTLSCSGMGFQFQTVFAGNCAEVTVRTLFAAPFEVLAASVETSFDLCRDALGVPSVSPA